MRSVKKVLTVLALLVLCLTLMAVSAFASEIVDSGTCGPNLTWELDDEGRLTISGTGDMWDYGAGPAHGPWYDDSYYNTEDDDDGNDRIKYVSIGEGVTSIGDYAFRGCDNLTAIYRMPSSVTSIGAFAFAGCDNLGLVMLSDNVTVIGACAFENCPELEIINLPSKLEEIKVGTFENCTSLTEITVPCSVTDIWDCAFDGCESLSYLSLPASLTNIGWRAFADCTALEDVYFAGTQAEWESLELGYYNSALTDATVHIGIAGAGECGWSEDGEVNELYWVLTGDGVMTISGSGSMFEVGACYELEVPWYPIRDGIKSLVVEEGVTVISHMKDSDNLTSITLPEGIAIDMYAFSGCDGLTDLVIPATTDIYMAAFVNCQGLTSVSLPEDLDEISALMFYGCDNLTNITIPASVAGIGVDAFSECSSLKNVFYGGSKSDWEKVYFGSGNDYLKAATVYYNQLQQPEITKLENTATGVKITWGAVNGAGKYRVFVKTSSGWSAVGTTTGTSLTYTGAKSGYTYTFTVRCVNAEETAFTSAYNATGWKQTYVAQPNVTKFENTASGVKITWGPVNGADKYRVFVKTSSGWATVGTTTGTSLTWTGAKSGCTYAFTVRCLNAAETAFTSSYHPTGWKQTYVAQPSISKFENTASGIKITWGAVNGAGKYRLFVKTSTGWATVGTTTGTSLTYTGAKSGYTYTFTVRALNSAGTAFVSSFNATGWKQTYVAMPSISKFENTASGIKITWNAVSGAGKYRVYVKTSTGWATVGTTTGTNLTYTGAKSGYTYTFTIRALNAAGTAFVSSYNATGWKQTYVAQPSVTKLTNTTSGIKVTWGAVNGAAKYRVFVKTSSGWKAIGTTTGTSLTWTGAKSGYTYTFTVRCLNSAGTAYTSSFNAAGWSLKRT